LKAGELRAIDLAKLYGLATSSIYRWRKLFGAEPPIENGCDGTRQRLFEMPIYAKTD